MAWRLRLIFIVILSSSALPALAQNPAVTINVDAALDQHPINPLIYGLNFADSATLNALNCTSNRFGGNRTSRYNWQQNVDHTGEFWYWESYPDANTPYGLADDLVNATQAANAEPLITIPMLDWISKTDGSRHILCSFPKSIYPAQNFFSPDCALYPGDDLHCCGDGFNGLNPILNPDPNNASTLNSLVFQTTFAQHLAGEGVNYYILDNEHGIWHETHRDVQPNGVDMDTIWGKMQTYAAMIKTADAGAMVLGPEEYGWTGYFYSGADIQNCNINNCWGDPPDWLNHCGGAGELPCDPINYQGWVLKQFHDYEVANGQRLLDVFTLHYYPQGDGTHDEFTPDTSNATQQLRNRSTRSLWDPNYVDQSWIGQAGPDNGIVRLIPRMKDLVNNYYPGTKIGVTEYHWGPTVDPFTGNDHIYSAITEADVLGIFGREGLDMANLYVDSFTNLNLHIASAFKMYRNYDGNDSTFGDTSVRDTVPDTQIDNVSSFAALRSSDGALTLMAVHKYTNNNTTQVTFNLSNFNHNGTAQVWRLNSNNTITQLPDKTGIVNSFTDTLPAHTITLYIVQPSAANPDFSLSCTPSSLFAAPGASDGSNCSVTPAGGFNNDVTLSCAGLPAGITCSFGTNPVTPPGSSALTVNVDGAVAEATYPFAVEGTDGVLTRSTNMSIVVSTGPAALLYDDFEDNNMTWTAQKGSWQESGGTLTGIGASTAIVVAPQPWSPSGLSGCSVCTLETDISLSAGVNTKVFIQPWYQSKSTRVDLILKPDANKIILKQVSGGVVVRKTKFFVALPLDTNHHIKLGYDGASFNLEVDGAAQAPVSAGATPSGNLSFKVKNTTATIQQVIVY